MAKARMCSDNSTVAFRCPGCGRIHSVPTSGPNAWGYNGNLDSPTLTPSLKVTYGPDSENRYCCHSVVTDGKIAFCDDCSHSHKGETMDIPEVDFDG